ncbi:MAG: hypothetical protein ACR2QG_09455 [Gammaproteobacteria bacterium]
MSTSLNERIANERRRLREVRESLTAAVKQKAQGDSTFVPFYIAIADYFEATMERLHRQDIRMGEMLRDKADMSDAENQQALSELDDRLAGNQTHLKQMLAARDQLSQQGAAALEEFEAAGAAYSDFIVTNMGHHPGSTNMAAKLFSAEDWAYMADVSAEDQAREAELFEQVSASRPAALS